jgi:hypothetical protein
MSLTNAERCKRWRATHPDYEKQWERANLAKTRASKNAWAKRNRKYWLVWRKQHPALIAASQKINSLILQGKLKRADCCSKCGSKTKIQGHHPDYSKPLFVIWLCYSCHLNAHGKSLRLTLEGSGVLNLAPDSRPCVATTGATSL